MGTNPSNQYRLGYGTTHENLTWVELAGGDAATYLHYPVIGLNPGVTYWVKVEKSGSEIYSQNVTTSMCLLLMEKLVVLFNTPLTKKI